MATCPFPQPAFHNSHWSTLDDRQLWALDCRHGRVLLLRHSDPKILLVWDPITGGRAEIPMPKMPCAFYQAMVLCAAADCDHCDCLGGPFIVIFLGSHGRSMHGCVYSSKASAWGTPVSITIDGGAYNYVAGTHGGALVGDHAYFTLRKVVFGYRHACPKLCKKATIILKYDFGEKFFSIVDIELPPDTCGRDIFTMPMENGSLGFAGIRDSSIYLWQRKVNPMGVAGWVPSRVVELEKFLPYNISWEQACVVGFAEGVGIMFVAVNYSSLFMIELKSEKVRMVSEDEYFYTVIFPFMSFCTPGSASILPLQAEN